MDQDEPRSKVAKTLLVGLALGLAVGIGQALGPDIAARLRIWVDRVTASVESSAVAMVERVQSTVQLERDVREGTGAVIWEAMQALEGEG